MAAILGLAFGCAELPRVGPSQTQAIHDDARALLSTHPTQATIDAAAWPESFKALHPQSVRSSEEGLYIVTGSRWVRESGVFVPRDARRFSPQTGADPEYTLVSNGIYMYRIRG
jgi:hypothetical protein